MIEINRSMLEANAPRRRRDAPAAINGRRGDDMETQAPQPDTLRKSAPETKAGGRALPSYIPTLDGWRAFAILLVLLCHAPLYRIGHFSTFQFRFYGEDGVEIFFILSGILICSRLLDEERLKGKIHLGGFYVRRLFRIQPAALVYLFAVLCLTLVGFLPTYWKGLLSALLMVRNLVGMGDPLGPNWVTGHFWSLSVEEHFYLFLPTFLILVRKRREVWILTLAVVAFVWAQFAFRQSHSSFAVSVRTDVKIYLLLAAAGIAVLLQRPGSLTFCRRWLRMIWIAPLVLVAVPDHSPVHPLLGWLLILPVLCTLSQPKTIIGRLFESAPIRFVGRISYSLYLWQELFLRPDILGGSLTSFSWLNRTPLVWVAVFAAAIASYYLVERPMVRLGHRMAPSATPGRV